MTSRLILNLRTACANVPAIEIHMSRSTCTHSLRSVQLFSEFYPHKDKQDNIWSMPGVNVWPSNRKSFEASQWDEVFQLNFAAFLTRWFSYARVPMNVAEALPVLLPPHCPHYTGILLNTLLHERQHALIHVKLSWVANPNLPMVPVPQLNSIRPHSTLLVLWISSHVHCLKYSQYKCNSSP